MLCNRLKPEQRQDRSGPPVQAILLTGGDGALYGRGERSWIGRRVSGMPDRIAEAVVRLVLGSRAARRRLVFEKIFGMKEPAA